MESRKNKKPELREFYGKAARQKSVNAYTLLDLPEGIAELGYKVYIDFNKTTVYIDTPQREKISFSGQLFLIDTAFDALYYCLTRDFPSAD